MVKLFIFFEVKKTRIIKQYFVDLKASNMTLTLS